ncbi:FecR family protein [Chitinophaga polysaccharea]|uniref:FecR family protein n=1 Tax=Chitinophaga polysaccharea TaxID=1293035 RepID=UPI00115BF5BD|nr:FecR family protein [Chitinophaga polysaccharea]
MEEQDFDYNLLVALIEGKADAGEKAQVLEWLHQNEQHKQLYFQVKDILDYAAAPGVTAEEADQRWQEIAARLAPAPAKGKIVYPWYRVAAAVAILMILTTAVLYIWFPARPALVTITNTEAAPRAVRLPDSSEVWLLNGSELSYTPRWEKEREVILKGTAFFEVSKHTEYPFTVKTQQMDIVVLGTSFIANSSPTTAAAAVTDGMVKAILPGKEWTLKPDEGVIFENGKSSKQIVHGSYYRMMKAGFFDFNNTSIREIAEILQVVYGYQVTVRQPEVLQEYSMSGHMAISDEENLHKAIEVIMHVTIIKNGQQIIIQPK